MRTRSITTSPGAKTSKRKEGIMRVKTLRDSLSSCSIPSTISTSTSMRCLTKADSLDSRSSSVRFKEVQIREYALTIGDNPSCSNGAPVSLDWTYNPSDFRAHLDKYEEYREPQRRHKAQLRMPKIVRHDLLMENWGFSFKAIMEAELEAMKARGDLMKTSIQARRAVAREESIRAIRQNLKKLFSKIICNSKNKSIDIISIEIEIDVSDLSSNSSSEDEPQS